MTEKGLNVREAYALASLAVDFRVAESVNIVQVVYGMIPKSVFKKKTDYWYKP
jgi:acetamidase/formamidase